MKIDSYEIKMSGSSEYTRATQKQESLVYWQGGQAAREKAYLSPTKASGSDTGNSLQGKAQSILRQHDSPVSLNFSADALKRMLEQSAKEAETFSKNNLTSSINTISRAAKTGGDKPAESTSELQIKLIEELFFRITGKKLKIKLLDAQALLSPKECPLGGQQSSGQPLNFTQPGGQAAPQGREPQGWGLDYNYQESTYESEKMSFRAKGMVTTSDGTEISLDVSLKMSREYLEEKSLSIKAGDALIDPLVINYAGSATDLADTKFEFDLDKDGSRESVSQLADGSGFLALDKNGDGKVNDGGELFGPSTGSGFKELAAYDNDQNGWIDENDAVYNSLKVWSKNPDGSDRLMGLAQVNIGAIYLGKADTAFSLTDDANQASGKIRESGIYLGNDGRAGIVHELDLVV